MMFRRQFVQLMTLVGAASLATIATGEGGEIHTVTYRVKGFSCVTCAVGLDAMLQRQNGVRGAQSTYPEGRVVVKFDPKAVSGASLQAFIAGMGFTVEPDRAD
jgi:copper chaperone CopZ